MSQKQKSRIGFGRGKIVLIGALVLVLYLVIMAQIPGGNQQAKDATSTPDSAKSEKKMTASVQPPPVSNSPEDAKPAAKVNVWNAVSYETAIVVDPFAVPLLLRAPVNRQERKSDNKLSDEELAQREQIKQEAIQRETERLKQVELEAKIKAQRMEFENEIAKEHQRIKDLIASIQEKGFDMVFTNSKTKLVKRGNQFLKENDVFEGVRVVEIHSDGRVVLESAYVPEPFSPSPNH